MNRRWPSLPDEYWQPLAPPRPIKGRGAVSRMPNRFEAVTRTAHDDGWFREDDEGGQAVCPATRVRFEDARSALSYNDSPDLPFDRSVNPYRGCEHGCIYCYARPTHGYLDLSPGLDFETRLVARRNIASVLRRELARPGYVPRPVAIGTVTDAYQPIERRLELTRSLLAVLGAARHPFSFVTKSSMVERDLDLIAPLATEQLVQGYVTITTLDAGLARILEPRAAAPARRLRTLHTLAAAGVPVGVSLAPQIPFINDDLEQVLAAAAAAGATSAFYAVLRLPWEVAPLFREWLQAHFPERAARVLQRLRDLHGGRDYDSAFGRRMTGTGIWADLLRQRFEKACRRYGLAGPAQRLDTHRFRAPAPDALARQQDVGQGVLF